MIGGPWSKARRCSRCGKPETMLGQRQAGDSDVCDDCLAKEEDR